MKRLISIIAACAVCLTLTACNTKSENSDIDKYAGLELITVEGDRMGFFDLVSLENACDIAVVGRYIDDPVQEVDYMQLAADVKGVSNILETSPVEISRVLMGDVEVGDIVNVVQRSGIVDDQLIVFDELTPIQKGDEWVFFLKKTSNRNAYWIWGASDARFPTKNSASKNSRMLLSDSWQLGVIDKTTFNEKVYNEIVEKYDV